MPNQTTNPPAPTIKSIADALGVSTRRVGQLRQAGMPVTSIQAAQDYRNKKPPEGMISTDELRAARYHLIKSQRERIDLENRLRSGELTLSSEAYASGLALGAAMKAAFLRLLNDLPPRLEGCTAIAIFQTMKGEFHRLLADMSGGDKYFNTPEMDQILADFHAARPAPWIPNKSKP
jgi:hypothetical protein